MMLPCGHVISRDSLIRLSKGGKIPSGTQGPLPQSDPVGADVFRGINTSAKLKCPYCPVESTAGQSLRVTF